MNALGLFRAGGILFLAAVLCACGKKQGNAPTASIGSTQPRRTPAPPADPLRVDAEWALAGLWTFYNNTFGPMIKSGHYDKELPVARLDHYAHRLWLPASDPYHNRDWTYEEAIKTLTPLVQNGELEIKQGEVAEKFNVAYFGDNHQLHRDQYAMIASEMGMKDIGGIPLERFVAGAMLGYRTDLFTRRIDLPWTVILLSKHVKPAQAWRNGKGEALRVEDVIRDMIAAPFFPEDRYPLACYDYHTVYALAAAVTSGYDEFADEARARMRKAFDRGESVCREQFKENPGSVDAVVGRIKLNGHLVEAYFRGGEKLFPMRDFRADVERAIEELARDSEKLRGLKVYEGSPDVFVAVPHAIHGLNLAITALQNQ